MANLFPALKPIISFISVIMISSLIGCQKMKSDCTDWVVKIDNEAICKSQIDMEYDAIIKTYAKMQGMDKDKFLEMINNDNLTRSQPLLLQLRKRNFVNRYINEYLFYREALKHKVQEEATVKAMLNYQRKSYISQYFLESSLKSEITVSDDEVEKFYKANRNKIPSLRQLPISQAFKRVRLYLIEQKKQRVLQQKVQELRDKFKIEMNKTVDSDTSNDKKEEKITPKKEKK